MGSVIVNRRSNFIFILQEDCFNVLASKIDTMGTAILVCGILVLLVQLFSILFSSVLCRAFRERGPAYYEHPM